MQQFVYMGVILFALSYPLAQSFEYRIQFATKWYALFPAIIITATFFIAWDYWFTQIGVWEFNSCYVLGLFFLGMPLEEWLFFLVVPFASVFIYEVLIYFVPKDHFKPLGKPFVNIMVPFLIGMGFLHMDKWYTSVNMFFGAAVILIHFVYFNDQYLGRFLIAYLVHLIPFFLCNGVLTGGLTEEPVVIYNNAENLGIRIWTVPIEDSIYALSLLLMNISIFEKIRSQETIATVRS